MSTEGDAARKPRRTGAIVAGVAGAAVLIALGVTYVVGASMTGSSLPRNASVSGIPVGGMTRAQATKAVEAGLASLADRRITVTAGDQKVTRPASGWGLSIDYGRTVAQAGGEQSWNPVDVWDNLVGGRDHAPVVTTDAATLDAGVADLAKKYDHDPVDAAITVENAKPTLVQGTAGGTLEREKTAELLQRRYLAGGDVAAAVSETDADITNAEAKDAYDKIAVPALGSPVTLKSGDQSVSLSPAVLAPALSFVAKDSKLQASVDGKKLLASAKAPLGPFGLKPAQDADVVLKDGKPSVVGSQEGRGIDPQRLADAVTPLLTKPAAQRAGGVQVDTLKPSFTTAQAQALGVKEITGEFTTRFPATAYRVNNIGKSARLVNNTLVKPGETFSMNEVLGPRTTARGWMAGGAIDGGKVVERMGGGISQTTTTTFNAIFFAGLEDVYHTPPSLYFDRYPMGREATLDFYSVDMKFRNDSKYGVLMQAFTNNPRVGGRGTVTVRVWSTKVYDIKATKPVQSRFRSPGKPVENNAAVCSPQSPMTGFRVDFQRQFYSGGKLVKSEPFTWTYSSLTAVTCTNPNARPDRKVR